MQLHGAEHGRVRLLSEPLTIFRAKLGPNGADADDVDQVIARFRWVPPHVEDICRACAEFYLTRLLQRRPTEEQIETDRQLLMISWSLRLDDGVYKTQVYPFPNEAIDGGALQRKDDALFDTLRNAAVRKQCTQREMLWVDYKTFERTEFPTVVTDEKWEELLESAQKKSLTTLFSEHGYWPVLRLLRGLAVGQQAVSMSPSGGGGRL